MANSDDDSFVIASTLAKYDQSKAAMRELVAMVRAHHHTDGCSAPQMCIGLRAWEEVNHQSPGALKAALSVLLVLAARGESL